MAQRLRPNNGFEKDPPVFAQSFAGVVDFGMGCGELEALGCKAIENFRLVRWCAGYDAVER